MHTALTYAIRVGASAAALGLAACGGGGGSGDDSMGGGGGSGGGGGGSAALDGSYHCVFFIDGTGLQTVPGFSISGGSYSHEDGSSGTVGFDGSTAEFSGGSLNGQGAVFEPGEPARLRIYNEDRSRTVIDCDRR